MKIIVFSAKAYDEQFFNQSNSEFGFDLVYLETRLNRITAALAAGADAICAFVNDSLDEETLKVLADGGTRIVALRCAGYNNVDLAAARRLKLTVVRVPAYSPYAVAEHSVALILTLNRKIHRAHNRVREGNFALAGLLGFDLHGQTVGIIGTGKIGLVFADIMQGFGCRVLAYDPYPNAEWAARGGCYVELPELFSESAIISLHCPLTPQTHHIINRKTIALMKRGVMLINTSRGALVDTQALINGLKSARIASVGLDVYEEEGDLFFEDLSDQMIQDDVFARLMTFPNVLVTGHQGFFTGNALQNIAATTLENIRLISNGQACKNEITAS